MNMEKDVSQIGGKEWLRWLQSDRYGADKVYREQVRLAIKKYITHGLQLLENVNSHVMVDVGCGDGILGFEAIRSLGSNLKVLFTDIDAELLAPVKQRAANLNVLNQCEFVSCLADSMPSINSGTADTVATRAALAYVENKPKALREFARILKPGGQLLLIEPIFRDEALATVRISETLAENASNAELKILHKWKSAIFPDTLQGIEQAALCNFGERDLFNWVQEAGFDHVHLELHIDQNKYENVSWDTFLNIAPHPYALTLKEIFETRFDAKEIELFESTVRPMLENQKLVSLDRVVFLVAKKMPD
jgi:arsenite methyltransferase